MTTLPQQPKESKTKKNIYKEFLNMSDIQPFNPYTNNEKRERLSLCQSHIIKFKQPYKM